VIRANLKMLLVAAGMRGWLPRRFVDWLIGNLGLRHA